MSCGVSSATRSGTHPQHVRAGIRAAPALAKGRGVDLEQGAVADREADVALDALPDGRVGAQVKVGLEQLDDVEMPHDRRPHMLEQRVLLVEILADQRRQLRRPRRARHCRYRAIERLAIKIDRDRPNVVDAADEQLEAAGVARQEAIELGPRQRLGLRADEQRDAIRVLVAQALGLSEEGVERARQVVDGRAGLDLQRQRVELA